MPGSDELSATLDEIIRLRRVARLVEPDLRPELGEIEDFLEGIIGPTVKPSEAARALGVTRPAIKKWLDRGEIASVITPRGRREVPLTELVRLLEEVDAARSMSPTRPLGDVIRERERQSREAIDIDRLLPRKRGRDHRVTELQSLAYHRLVAERLNEDLVRDAHRRLKRWIKDERIDSRWAERWSDVLSRPIDEIARVIASDSARSRELRQTSPFAGVLTEQERRRLFDAVERRAASA
jgi:excisionase family DNA binding protein